MRRNIIIYGSALAALLILLKWLEWRFIVYDHAIEIYSGVLALLFTGLGIWLAVKLARPKVRTIVVVQSTPENSQPIPEPGLAATVQYSSGNPTPSNPGFPRPLQYSPAPAPPAPIDENALAHLGLSDREQEVLQLMAEGLSNQEIASRLFVSVNTVKTHCSRIFEKLDVKRRTQAVEKSRRLGLIH